MVLRWSRVMGSGDRQSGPLLVDAAVAVPEDQLRAFGGGRAGVVEASAGDRVAVAAVVRLPLLVGAAVAVPDLDPGAVGGTAAGGVEALAERPQGAVGAR